MKLDKVKYYNDKPYAEYERKSGRQKGYKIKIYGRIIKCKSCGKLCFIQNSQKQGQYCSPKCEKGQYGSNWRGGKKKDRKYLTVLAPRENRANKYIGEHRLVIEKKIGRYLHSWEICHHINKIKTDNRPQNLMVFKGNSTHRNFEVGKNVDPKDIIFDGRQLA